MSEELQIEQAEFSQDSQEVAALAAAESALVPYVSKSKAPFRLDTLIPRNMAFEVQKALNRIVRLYGNLDNLVRNHLKYLTVEELWKALAAEQVDALALYIAQFDREQGIIIADQTGIGKGRQAAGVIRHAIVNGYLPVFFTRKPDLFSDMYRDLGHIGFSDIKPFILNTDNNARVKDAEGHVVFSPLSSKDQYELLVREREIPTDSLEAIEWFREHNKPMPDPEDTPAITVTDVIDHLPTGYDCVFCTYSQIQSAGLYKRLWLAKLLAAGMEGSRKYKKVVFVLDESHMAGGFDSIIGNWMRAVLPQAKACAFLSATFAKYPEVMPFYAKKTAIHEAGLTDINFVNSMRSGGLALQEIVAANLAESGQLIRRQRSNEGIEVKYLTLDREPELSKNRDRVNRITRLMNEVVEFEQTYIVPVISELHRQAKQDGEHLDKKPKSLGVKHAPYFSRVFNIIDQMLFSLKVEEVAKQAIALLKQDKKVVIAFKSTMGTFLKDLNLVNGDVVQPSQLEFSRTMVKGLDSVFYYNYTDIDNSKSRRHIPLDMLSPGGQKRYREIRELMQDESTGLSISPIDQLIHLIEKTTKDKHLGGHEGPTFTVAEVTGRNQRIRMGEGEAIVQSFRTDAEKYFRLFNQGDFDVLLINASGSTGSSAHASKDYKDQRQRWMIIHQFELDINTEVQKRGRTNRTGQVVLPGYLYITSAIPSEQRLMNMLKSKLKMLDANTTGSQKTSEDTLRSADFMNKYGDKVAWKWVDEHPMLAERMGNPTYHKNWGGELERNDSPDGAMRQVTGRAGLLYVEEQEQLYNELLEAYEYQVEYEKQSGTYDLETEFLPLDAEVKKRFLYRQGKGGKTPFGRDTVREVSIVNNLKRPFTKNELDQVIVGTLDGRKPKEVQAGLLNTLGESYPALLENRREKRLETVQKLREELEELPEPGSEETQEKNARLERNRERLQELIQSKLQSLELYMKDLEKVRETISKHIGYWQIGEVVKVPIPGALQTSWGVFLEVRMGQAKNPWTLGNISLRFAVTDSRRVVEYRITPEQRRDISMIFTESKDVSDKEARKVLLEWNEMVKQASLKREKRHILTENIVGVADELGYHNRLIKYNTKDGTIKNGILLHRSYGQEGEDRKALLPISGALKLLKGMAVDKIFGDDRDVICFKKVSDSGFQVYITKKGNFQLHTDETLRSLIMREPGQDQQDLGDFVQNAGDMTAALHQSKLERFLERLDEFNLHYLGEARELEDWEEENEAEWRSKSTQQGAFRYKLGRPYGQGSNPAPGFVDYTEPDAQHPYGVVEYNRPLTAKERYNYSLIPLFRNVEEPYNTWKAFLEKTALQEDFGQLTNELSGKAPHEAMLRLGYFIWNNPHEDGNPEFVFGQYDELALGRAAYEDQFGEIQAIDELIAQLMIELETPMKVVA